MENYNEAQASITENEAVAPVEQPAIADEQPMICEEVPENAQNQACCQEKPNKKAKKLNLFFVLTAVFAVLSIFASTYTLANYRVNTVAIDVSYGLASICCIATAMLTLLAVFKRKNTFLAYIPYIITAILVYLNVMIHGDPTTYDHNGTKFEIWLATYGSDLSATLNLLSFITYITVAMIFSILHGKTEKKIFKWIHFAAIIIATLSFISMAGNIDFQSGFTSEYYHYYVVISASMHFTMVGIALCLLAVVPNEPFACEKCNENGKRILITAAYVALCAIAVLFVTTNVINTRINASGYTGYEDGAQFLLLLYPALAIIATVAAYKPNLGFITEILITILVTYYCARLEVYSLIPVICLLVAACVFSAIHGFKGGKVMKWLYFSFFTAAIFAFALIWMFNKIPSINFIKYIIPVNTMHGMMSIVLTVCVARIIFALRPSKKEIN